MYVKVYISRMEMNLRINFEKKNVKNYFFDQKHFGQPIKHNFELNML